MDPSCPPPSPPVPWRWQCHRCGIWYSLSCTRRCLSCSHVFCQETMKGNISNADTTESSPRLRRQSRTRLRKKKKGGPCISKFDFDGWAAWGSWRRRILVSRRLSSVRKQRQQPEAEDHAPPLLGRRDFISSRPRRKELEAAAYMTWKPKDYYLNGTRLPKQWVPRCLDSQVEVLKRKEEMYFAGEHDCSVHCDFPNECGLTVYAAKEREREAVENEVGAGSSPDDALVPDWSTEQNFEIFCDPVLSPDRGDGEAFDGQGDGADMEEPHEELEAKRDEEMTSSVLAAHVDVASKLSETGITGHPEADEYLDWISNDGSVWDE